MSQSTPLADDAVHTGVLVLADGTVFRGRGIGAIGDSVGEVCFNTSMTGYQEILTDPSYAGQIITFTFPHIGNTGTNIEDIETVTRRRAASSCAPTSPTRPTGAPPRHLDEWLKSYGLIGLAGVDTGG
ncbi:carbamoyl-phosphate synthase domain-containing protein [Azospirillum thermophilum]|uniref:carbamoyl-phosphate synthase domain-containing protein n=1 Tax=Azospirillum thermophilum TaxID=2202148 RepID=UPI001FE64985|nr:carbamoyl-phosphate synthase domain-containing protein [Azospirillum thermophilum]